MKQLDATEDRLLRIIRTQNEIATSDLDLATAMQLAADRALELTGARAALIETPEGSEIVFEATAGEAGLFRGERVDRADSLAGQALALRRILISDDFAADSRAVRPDREEIGCRSLISAPLFHRTEAIGVLTVCHDEPHHFGGGEVQTLELLSDLIAAHLSHAALLAEEAHDSRHDPLTDLPNRRAYEERLRHELARALRYGHPMSLCLLDLDGFKAINDDLGHPAGDQILRAVADAIRTTREADEGFRVGGDEFAILLPDTTARGAIAGVQRLIDALSQSEVAGLERIGVSYGIASGERDPDALHAAADRELLAAKATLYGRDRRDPIAA